MSLFIHTRFTHSCQCLKSEKQHNVLQFNCLQWNELHSSFWTRLHILIYYFCTYTRTHTLTDTYTHWLPCSSPMMLQYCMLALHYFAWLYSPNSCFMTAEFRPEICSMILSKAWQGQFRVNGVEQRPGKYKYYITITIPPKASAFNSAIAIKFIYIYICVHIWILIHCSVDIYINPSTNTMEA